MFNNLAWIQEHNLTYITTHARHNVANFPADRTFVSTNEWSTKIKTNMAAIHLFPERNMLLYSPVFDAAVIKCGRTRLPSVCTIHEEVTDPESRPKQGE